MEPDFIPSVAAHGEGELPEDALTVLCVRYTGTSNYRILNHGDLNGNRDGGDELIWTPGSDIPWELWLDYAGSEERAWEVFRANAHEFILVGPGADEMEIPEVEEFAIGGVEG